MQAQVVELGHISPADIPGLEAWFDADDAGSITLASGKVIRDIFILDNDFVLPAFLIKGILTSLVEWF